MAQLTNSYANNRLVDIDGAGILKALLAGLIGTAAITVLMYNGPLMGFPRMDIATMLGTMFVSDTSVAFALGMVMHFMIGLTLALLYAAVFVRFLPGQPWLRGALYGLLPWLMAMAAVMPMMAMAAVMPMMAMMAIVHPMVLSGAMPAPGFFLAGMGTMMAPLGSLMGHLVYGAAVEAIYGRPKARHSY